MKTSLIVMRGQPVHLGHCKLIDLACDNSDTVIIGLGSVSESRTKLNPFNEEERRTMLRNIYGARIKIVPLVDIGAERGTSGWVDYVLGKIAKINLPTPTQYWTGSIADAQWYLDHFYLGDVSDSKLHLPEYKKYWVNDSIRLLHLIDRSIYNIPAGTEIRTLIETRSDLWKKWIPEQNHEYIENTYPEFLRVRK